MTVEVSDEAVQAVVRAYNETFEQMYKFGVSDYCADEAVTLFLEKIMASFNCEVSYRFGSMISVQRFCDGTVPTEPFPESDM